MEQPSASRGLSVAGIAVPTIAALRSSSCLSFLKERLTQVTPRQSGTIIDKGRKRGNAAIVQRIELGCPAIGKNALASLFDGSEPYFTRHMDGKWAPIALNGYLRFGTVESYRATEAHVSGRFGDEQEGTQRDVFRSRSGIYNARIGAVHLNDVHISGYENPVAIEYTLNEWCLCGSYGAFDVARAARLRDSGNSDLNYFLTYDLRRLASAISKLIEEDARFSGHVICGRKIEYGEKDRHWQVENGFEHSDERDRIAIWLSTLFVKPRKFAHEQEFRLVVLNANRPGGLSLGSAPLELESDQIREAIVQHGSF